MKKDDALAILRGVANHLISGEEIRYSDKLMLALDTAIEALKEVKNQNEELNNSNESSLTQNALDTISRQKAIDAVDEALTRVFVEHRDIAEKVINKIPSALEAQEWIPVDKKSHPDTPERVQVQLGNGWIITAYYQENEWISVPDCGAPIEDRWIEAWKPLPEPYREEGEK